ncbi:MAG: helix-turn-helix domain-containing protein [Streptosporangiaceae bacterium]
MSEAKAPVSNPVAGLLREARTVRGISQRTLAEAAGVPQSIVSAVESGRRQPSGGGRRGAGRPGWPRQRPRLR